MFSIPRDTNNEFRSIYNFSSASSKLGCMKIKKKSQIQKTQRISWIAQVKNYTDPCQF